MGAENAQKRALLQDFLQLFARQWLMDEKAAAQIRHEDMDIEFLQREILHSTQEIEYSTQGH